MEAAKAAGVDAAAWRVASERLNAALDLPDPNPTPEQRAQLRAAGSRRRLWWLRLRPGRLAADAGSGWSEAAGPGLVVARAGPRLAATARGEVADHDPHLDDREAAA